MEIEQSFKTIVDKQNLRLLKLYVDDHITTMTVALNCLLDEALRLNGYTESTEKMRNNRSDRRRRNIQSVEQTGKRAVKTSDIG